MTWFIASTIPGLDRSVEDDLKERKIDCYLPRYRTPGKRRRDGTRVEVRRPLLPGYLFVEVDLEREVDGERISFSGLIEAVVGLRDFLRSAATGHPMKVADVEVQKWRNTEASGKWDVESIEEMRALTLDGLKEGDEVTIIGGRHFTGHSATVKRAEPGRTNVLLSVSLFGRVSTVKIARADLERAPIANTTPARDQGAAKSVDWSATAHPVQRPVGGERRSHRLTRKDNDATGQRGFGEMAIDEEEDAA